MSEDQSHLLRLRAACICFKHENAGSDEILLVESRKACSTWSFPGGGWEEGETLEETADRELFEEAGCEATFKPSIGAFKRGNRVTFLFEGHVTQNSNDWPEKSKRNRQWFPKSQVMEKLKSPFERAILKWYLTSTLNNNLPNSTLNNHLQDCANIKSASISQQREPVKLLDAVNSTDSRAEFNLPSNCDKLPFLNYIDRELSVGEDFKVKEEQDFNMLKLIGHLPLTKLTNLNFNS